MSPTQIRTASRTLPAPIATLGDLVALAKPRLSGMVVSTTAAGMWLAPSQPSAPRAAAVLVGTGMVVGAANASMGSAKAGIPSPRPSAVAGERRPDGSGRSQVRRMRASTSRSR